MGLVYDGFPDQDLYGVDGSFIDFSAFMDTVGLDFEVNLSDLNASEPMVSSLDAASPVTPISPELDYLPSMSADAPSKHIVPDLSNGEGWYPVASPLVLHVLTCPAR